MSSIHINRCYGDRPETRSRPTVRSSSVALDSRTRATSQTIDAQEMAISRMRSPSAVPSKRWSSILEVGSESYQPRSRPPLPPTPNVTRTRPSLPSYPTYTDALLKHSKKLREQSMSPTRNLTVVNTESYTPYKTNQDYYKGKVKSVYEKEPLFKDFYRNIPLSESNFYDSHNLTRIKQRFNNMVQNKTGRDMITARYDPYTPSGRFSGIFEPKSERLAVKHKAVVPTPAPLPFIYVYHRHTRR